MKIWDIIKTVGSGIIRETVPGGGLLLGAVNELLPEDKKLPASATGHQLATALESLPAADRAKVLAKEFDVDLADVRQSNATVRAMLAAELKTPHTTRPYIARGSFHVIAFVVILAVSIWAWGVLADNAAMVVAVVEGWPFLIAAIGPLVSLLWAYFGILRHEHKSRLDAASGSSGPSGIAGLVSTLMNRR